MAKFISKQFKAPAFLWVTMGVGLLLMGIALAVVVGFNRSLEQSQSQQRSVDSTRAVLLLLPLTPAQRAVPLTALAQLENSRLSYRARYLLATDLIQQQQGERALVWLEKLQDYPPLAAEVALKRGQAYEISGNPGQAKVAWQNLLQRYGDQPPAAEALYFLGRSEPHYWNRAIAQFPAHPRTIKIVQTRLKQNPKQPQLLLLVARHGLHLANLTSYLDQLVQYKAQLTPLDWEAIAFGYWEKQAYGKAARAYTKSPPTSRNRYRAARGLQLDGQAQAAAQAYQRMVAQFPQAQETPTALIRLASLSQSVKALQYLDAAIRVSPVVNVVQQSGAALLAKARLLDSLGRPQAAAQARQLLLSTYGSTDAAAELRWQVAQQKAAAQDFLGAMKLARQITTHSPQSELAPEATFWTGKWARRLGMQKRSETALQHVLTRYPDSYYAWRAAVLLGWEVGDFTTVRQLTPQLVEPSHRLPLPAGSAALQELYQLGQNHDAWIRWQWEYQLSQRMDPTLAEQFTDGLLHLGVEEYLEGIFSLSNLRERSRQEGTPALSQYQVWQRQPEYWEALYPLPFAEIVEKWSRQRNLNPLLVMALIRQESRFQPAIQSPVGAVGLMQVMPETASWIAEKTNLGGYTLVLPEDNLKLGTWYLVYTHQSYNNNSMLAVASYNAGPGNVADWVKEIKLSDPDEFVEAIPFPETKNYVKAVFENYWNYLRLYNPEISQRFRKRS